MVHNFSRATFDKARVHQHSLGAASVSSDPSKKQLSRSRANGGRILRHDSDPWLEEVEELEVVEGYVSQSRGRRCEHAEGREGVEAVSCE